MIGDFEGWVLRKPRVASSNAAFTAEGDVVVRGVDDATYRAAVLNDSQFETVEYLVRVTGTNDLVVPDSITETATAITNLTYQFNPEGRDTEEVTTGDVTPTPDSVDTEAGLITYSSDPGSTVTVTYTPKPLSIEYTKNESSRARFGFDDRVGRWSPLPGAAPDEVGPVPADGLLTLPVLQDGVSPRVILGSPDSGVGTQVSIPSANLLSEDAFADYRDGVLSVDPGEGIVNTDTGELLLADDLISSFEAQQAYYTRTSFFDFSTTGQVGEVSSTDSLYLNPIPLASETPLLRLGYRSYLEIGTDATVNTTTGEVTFSAGILSSFEGETLYYDGVLTGGPVQPYAPTALGTLGGAIATIDLTTYEPDNLILFVSETALAIREVVFVDTPANFEASRNLPPQQAQVSLSNGEVRLSQSFVTQQSGNTLQVGTGDIPLENGISFRYLRSPVDPTNERGVPDGRGTLRIADEVLQGTVNSGPTVALPQVPLVDIAGYADNTFYRLQKGAKRTVLTPDEDVIYDFDNRQLLWAQRRNNAQTITQSRFDVRLPDQVLLDRNFSFEINEGSGFTNLEPAEDVVIDFDTGILQFVEVLGSTQVEGAAQVSGSIFTFLQEDLSGITVGADPLDRPLLVTGESAYVITDITGQDVTVAGTVTETGSIQAEILEAPEILYIYALGLEDLAPIIVRPFIVQEVDSTGQVFAPAGASVEVYQGSTQVPVVVLASQVLGEVGDTLTLPAFAQIPEANFSIYREATELTFTAGVPASGEYTISGTDVVLNAQDVIDFAGDSVILDPALSSPRASGDVELLAATRELGFPLDVQDTSGIFVWTEVAQDGFTLNNTLLYLARPMRQGEELVVRYTTSSGSQVEEQVGFRTTETVSGSTYGAGRELDTSRTAQSFVNGVPTDLIVDPATGTLDVSSVDPSKTITVSYAALDALGGEQSVTLLQEPLSPEVVLEVGQQQTLQGDQTDVLFQGAFVQADAASFEITTAPTFDGDVTTFEISPSLTEELRNPQVLVSQTTLSYVTLAVQLQDTSVGEQEVRFFGDVTDLIGSQKVLKLDGDPYYIQEVTLDQDSGLTVVGLASALAAEYVSPTVEISAYPVYPPGTAVLQAAKLGREDLQVRLFRVDANDDATLITEDAFLYEAAGRVTLDPTLVDLPTGGEVWYLNYTALREVGPTLVGGQVFFPRFRGEYTKRANATEDNGYLNSQLLASYTLHAPDTFYLRVVDLEEYAGEVAEQLSENAASSAPAGGPIITTNSSQALSDKGNDTLIWEGGDLYDQDRASRRYLTFYNGVINAFENLLEVITGQAIGGRDGKFRFTIRADDSPGGEDPVTGRLLPYYINEANPGVKPTSAEIEAQEDLSLQKGRVLNNMDDILLVSKRPFSLNLSVPPSLVYEGTFKSAWQPSKFSRLYPEESAFRTVTVPSLSGGGSYTAGDDFNKILADAKIDGVLSLRDVAPRGAAATVTSFQNNGSTVTIGAAQTYDPLTGAVSNSPYDLTTGDPSRTRPPFEVGQHVNIGRVTFSRSGEIITRTEVLVAQDLVIDSVTTTELVLSEGSGTAIGSVTAEVGDTVFVVPSLDLSATVSSLADLDPEDMPYYRAPLDILINESDGELLNPTLPSFFADLLGQKVPPPGTYLDGIASYKNQRLQPFRFPSLDGEGVNDDGDVAAPFVSPYPDSELQRLPAELTAISEVFTTQEGAYAGVSTKTAPSTLSTTNDLSGLGIAPFDVTLLEGISTVFAASQAGVNTLTLAAFEYEDPSVSYDVPNLYQGSGTVSGDTLTDGSTDFTAFSGATITLNIDGGNSYSVSALNNGSIVATIPIVETGAQSYTLSASGTGSISADLTTLQDTGVDFSSATGTFTIQRPGTAGEVYTIDDGAVDELYPLTVPDGFSAPVAVSPDDTPIASGTGAIVAASDILETANSIAGINAGDTLMIGQDDANASRYRVASVQSGAPNVITIDTGADANIWRTSFLVDSGDSGIPDYPVNWRVVRPRRYSVEVQDYQDEFVRQRVTYQSNSIADADIAPLLTATTDNPSTPYKERVDQLVDLLLDTPFVTTTGQATAAGQTLDGVDFVAEGVQQGDIVRVDSGVNRGFYVVTNVTSAEITVDGSSDFVTYTLVDDAATSYTITRADVFETRTYQLALSEQFGVDDLIDRIDDGIRATVTDTDDLLGTTPYGTLTGDPTDAALTAHQDAVNDRLDRIRDVAPTLPQDIEGVLKGSEALYDVRYAWIDYRTNLETGTLPRIQRYEETLTKRQNDRLRELLRLLSTGEQV